MFGSALLFGLAALFLATGVSKGLRQQQFLIAVASYRLVPRTLAPHVARLAIGCEIAGAVLAVGPEPWGRIGLGVLAAIAASGGVLAGFDLLAGNTDHPCGCIGQASSGRLEWWHPVRSAAVAVVFVAFASSAYPRAWAAPWPLSLLLLAALALGWSALLATLELRTRIGAPWRSTGPSS